MSEQGWAGRLIGRTVGGRYRLDRLLGAGGMGAVFAGTHVHVGRRVAVKMILPELARDPGFAERFRREARAAGELHSPGVVEVLDYDVDEKLGPYLVMEYLEGESLLDRLRTVGRFAPAEAVALATALLEGMGAVHARGIVHRDLKPPNIFLAREHGREVVKILDFGIARMAISSQMPLTLSGTAVGTPRYMAPEQALGAEVDARADLYAIGAVLYAVLAGRPPYLGVTDATELRAAVLRGPPEPLAQIAPDVPARLRAVIETAMQRDPAQRFASAAAMRAALLDAVPPAARPAAPLPPSVAAAPSPPAAITAVPPTRVAPARSRWRWGLGAGGVALLVSCLGCAVWYYAIRHDLERLLVMNELRAKIAAPMQAHPQRLLYQRELDALGELADAEAIDPAAVRAISRAVDSAGPEVDGPELERIMDTIQRVNRGRGTLPP